MVSLGAFDLVFLEAQVKSTCISHNSFLYTFCKTMHNKTIIQFQLVFLISGIIKVFSASVISLD